MISSFFKFFRHVERFSDLHLAISLGFDVIASGSHELNPRQMDQFKVSVVMHVDVVINQSSHSIFKLTPFNLLGHERLCIE